MSRTPYVVIEGVILNEGQVMAVKTVLTDAYHKLVKKEPGATETFIGVQTKEKLGEVLSLIQRAEKI